MDFADDVYFDPNRSRYKCLCNQLHSTTGVRLIAVFLLLSVVLEIYHLLWYVAFTDDTGDRLSAAFQLSIGAALAISVCAALKSENALYLSPYLLFMTVGFAAGTVIFVALLYISFSQDLETIRSFLETQLPYAVLDDLSSRSLTIFGWVLVASAACLIGLQFWMLTVVFACWRYYRDKREFGYSNKNSKSLVVLYPSKKAVRQLNQFIRSKSAEEVTFDKHHSPITHTISFGHGPRDTIIIA